MANVECFTCPACGQNNARGTLVEAADGLHTSPYVPMLKMLHHSTVDRHNVAECPCHCIDCGVQLVRTFWQDSGGNIHDEVTVADADLYTELIRVVEMVWIDPEPVSDRHAGGE